MRKEHSALRTEVRSRLDALDARLASCPAAAPEPSFCASAIADRVAELREMATRLPRSAAKRLLEEYMLLRSGEAKVAAAELFRGGAGERFPESERMEKNYRRAWEIAEDALRVENGCASALLLKGDMLRLGLGRKADLDAAEQCFREAVATSGSAQARFLLGKCVYKKALEPEGVVSYTDRLKWMQDAKTLLERALAMGAGEASVVLGYVYERGWKIHDIIADVFAVDKTPEQCVQKCIELYKEGARLGSPQAMNNLGHTYVFGSAGSDKSTALALEWFSRASESGLTRAYANAGQLCEHADMDSSQSVGFPLGLEEARQWYLRGSKMRDAFSTVCLARLDSDGLQGSNALEATEKLLFLAIAMAEDAETPDVEANHAALVTLARIYLVQAVIDPAHRSMWRSKLSRVMSPTDCVEMRQELDDHLVTALCGEVSGTERVPETGLSAQEANVELRRLFGQKTARLLLARLSGDIKKLDMSLLVGDKAGTEARLAELGEVLSPDALQLLERMRTTAIDNRVRGITVPAVNASASHSLIVGAPQNSGMSDVAAGNAQNKTRALRKEAAATMSKRQSPPSRDPFSASPSMSRGQSAGRYRLRPPPGSRVNGVELGSINRSSGQSRGLLGAPKT